MVFALKYTIGFLFCIRNRLSTLSRISVVCKLSFCNFVENALDQTDVQLKKHIKKHNHTDN